MNLLYYYTKALLIIIAVPSFVQGQFFPDLKFFPVHSNTPWPTKKINGQIIDQRGLVWFTTESSGLLRYDGNAIKQYISADSISTSMHDISIDNNNMLYISAGDGLISYNTLSGETKRYKHNINDTNSVADDDKPNPFVDSRNRVWVTGKGLQQLDTHTGKFINYTTPDIPKDFPQTEFNRFESMTEDGDGNIWIASAYGLYKADTINKRVIPYYNGKYASVTNVFVDNKHQIWISTWGAGVMKFDPGSGKYTMFNLAETSWGITHDICEYEDINHKQWICFASAESLILLDPVSEKCNRYFAGSYINRMYTDKHNRLWLFTGNGVFTVDNVQQQITVHPLFLQSAQSVGDYGHPRFWFDHGDEIWLSAYFGKGVSRYSKDLKFISKNLTIPPSSNNLFSKVVNNIKEDANKNIWYSTDSGLVKQSGKSYTVFMPGTVFSVDKGTSLRNILQRSDGKWWIRSIWKAMHLFNPVTEKFERSYIPDSAGMISASTIDKQGRLWIGTDKGMFFFDESKEKFISFPLHDERLRGDKLLNYIMDMLPDDNNRIWLSTYAGIAIFDIEKKQFSYPEVNEVIGFSPSFRILQDHNKIIWVIADEKLVAVNPLNGQSKFFRSEIGLPNGFDDIGVFRQSKDGNIWLAYPGGLCSFNPEKLLSSSNNNGKIIITDIYEDGERQVYNDSLLSIHKGIDNIRISFAYTNYSIPEQNVLYFKLYNAGDTSLWQKSNGEINLVNLLPGTYVLELKGENRSLNTPALTATYTLIISPQWYQTFLFKLALLLIATGIIFTLIRLRIKGIKSKALVKQKIAETEMAALKAQMNPHFMFNCINSIDAFIYSNDKYNATLYLNKFARLLRNILDHSRENTVLLSKDIDTLKMYIEMEELRHEGKFRTVLRIDEQLPINDVRVPPLIIQPFVENAILHGLKNKTGNDGVLTVEISWKDGNVQYNITDNGIGRKAAGRITTNKTSSYGMKMSFDRIKLFNSEETPSVKIEDVVEDGTVCGTIVYVLLKTGDRTFKS